MTHCKYLREALCSGQGSADGISQNPIATNVDHSISAAENMDWMKHPCPGVSNIGNVAGAFLKHFWR